MDPKDSQSEFTEDDDSHWFDKNINLGESVSSLTESTDHDELSRDFTQDELNLVHSDDHLEPTNNEDLITDKLDEHDDLKSEQNNLTPETDLNLELPEDSPPQKGSNSDEELENELLEGGSLSIESKKDDITKELTDIFFQTQHKTQFSSELSEDNNKDVLTDILDKEEPTAFSSELIEDNNKDTLPDILHEDGQKEVRNDGDIGETIKNELSKIIDDVDLNPELESKTMDVVQELQEHIKLVDSHQGTEDLDGEDKVINTICIGTKDIEEELEESRVNKNVVHESTEDDLNHESNSMSLDKVPVISKIDDELIKEPAMVEFIHDSENSVKININTENNHSKFVVSDVKSGLNAETIVMETDEGEQIVFNAEVIATESNSTTLNVEGGAEFLEAVTGSLDELLETEDEPVPEPAMRRKKEPLKCFVSSCKSGKSGTRTSFRYFKPPESVLKKWQTILTQDGEELTTESTVCELHFKSGHIFKKGVDASGTVIWGLREGALPTVHNAAMPKPTSKTVSVPKVTKAPETTYSTLTVNKNAAVVSSKVLSAQRKSPKFIPKPLRPSPRQAEMNDPDFLVKNPELLKTAQDELLSLDVLVCGDCRSVFHFVKDFSHHKENLCNGKSTFKANISESKAQVWAFLLWKSAQAKLLTDVESPWKLYQRWCKMDDNVREAWTTAGNSLMDLTSLGHSKLSDGSLNKTSYVPARPGRPPSNRHEEEEDDGRNSNIIMKKVKRLRMPSEGGAGDGPTAELEEEPMETEDDPSSGKVEEQERESAEQNQSQNDNLPEDIQIKEEVMSEEEEEEDVVDEEDNKESENVRDRLRERRHMPEYKNKVVPKQDKKIVSKSNDDSQDEEEFVVEKIVSRRYNSKKKQFEYLLKWEGYPSEQNTWEPAENMATCQHLLKAFEATLVKQHTAKQGGLTPGRPPMSAKKRVETFAAGPSGITSQGRPDRRSKQKALDQVKAWCGTIKPTEEDYGLKRKIESDSDFDEDDLVPSKKLKGDSEDDIRSPKKFVRVGQRFGRPEGKLKPSVNGYKKESNLAAALGLESDSENDSERANVASPSPEKSHPVVRKMSSLSVQNQKVLVANAKGVVKVDPSHVPNLTSGVYIMSNTKGILKVDNTALSTSLQNQASIKKSPGIDVSSTPTINTENSSTPQKSGIIRRPAGILGGVGGTLPRGPINTPLRPQGLLRSTRPGFSPRPSGIVRSSIAIPSPRPLGIPSGITTKIQGAVRPKGSLPLGQSAVSPKSPSLQPKTTILQKTPPLPTTKTSPLKPSPLQPTVVQPKATTPLPKIGALQKSPLTTKPPQKPPIKPTLKPIESILGVGFQQVKEKYDFSEFVSMNPQKSPFHSTSPEFKFPVPVKTYYKQKMLLAKKRAALTQSSLMTKDNLGVQNKMNPTKESGAKPIRKILPHPLVFRNRGRGIGSRGNIIGRGRGFGRGSSLSTLLRMDQNREVAVKESKLVENDNLLMEFREESDSNESDDGGLSDHFPDLNDPIEPVSPPRPMSLCPLTGKVLLKAEGEKTPEPTPPPSPKPPSPKIEEDKEPEIIKFEPASQPTSILPDDGDTEEDETVMKGMMCKVEMSPGGTTGTVLETGYVTPATVTEGTVTIKRSTSPHAVLRGPQLSVISGSSGNSSLGNTITVPAKKIFDEEDGGIGENVVTITADDGLVYQVKVSSSDVGGNTVLMSSGEDGQQQCVYVTTDTGEGGGDESAILTLDTAYADAVAQLGTEQFYIRDDNAGELVTLDNDEGSVVGGDDQGGQVVAQLVEAGEPAPGGGPRRVVLLLPDGNLMMTEVDEEQYAALDLDK